MKRQQLKSKRISNILDNAESAIIEHGLFSLSLLELARQSDCPVNTLYNYFSSREDVAVGLFNRMITKWGVKATQELTMVDCGTFQERFLAMQLVWVIRARAEEDRGGIQFVAAMPCVWQHASHKRIATTRNLLAQWYQLNEQFLMMARSQGILEADDEALHHSINLVTCVERGFSLFSNNHNFRDEMLQLPVASVLKVMIASTQELKWQSPHVNVERVIELCETVITTLESADVDEFIAKTEESLTDSVY
ncbi:TetR/AcrR family transcriptional regulator [Ferrimonas aestuarii]|uniref:TetR/AcrR family transcriptional regulator n=1 Tax=Ferrimonas aestuarii TaxID=2569539 RepID=A0A4U1BR81_9GAMM|nr:TetR/AcrR family transcriptional regulator [Ferrimonas aestuarii]TKB55424.1 TetR/AcrR family transcriptional regulator [Ferrimonas aestuarii]